MSMVNPVTCLFSLLFDWYFALKGNHWTHISIYCYYKVFIFENNQWKFEQNQAKNKEVTALWNLAISRGRYSKWWQVVDNSPYVLYMKNFMFFHFSGDWDNFLLWNQDMTSKDVFYMAYYEIGPMKTHVSIFFLF